MISQETQEHDTNFLSGFHLGKVAGMEEARHNSGALYLRASQPYPRPIVLTPTCQEPGHEGILLRRMERTGPGGTQMYCPACALAERNRLAIIPRRPAARKPRLQAFVDSWHDEVTEVELPALFRQRH